MDETECCPECFGQELRIESVRNRVQPRRAASPDGHQKVVAQTTWLRCAWCEHTWPVTKPIPERILAAEKEREGTITAGPPVSCHRALTIAYEDAVPAYRNPLTNHRIVIHLESNGWNIEFQFRPTEKCQTGGGPYYVINADTGEIVSKTYHQ